MNKKVLILVLVLVLLIAGAGIAYNSLADQVQLDNLALGETVPAEIPDGTDAAANENLAPDFTVYDKEGNAHSLSDFRGKPVIVNFWASWCGPCKNEMPAFNTAWGEYGDRVQFLMVNLTDNYQETLESAKAFLDTVDYSFPVFFDTKMEGGIAYSVTGIPATYFINAEGQVVARAVQSLDYDTLVRGIGMILED